MTTTDTTGARADTRRKVDVAGITDRLHALQATLQEHPDIAQDAVGLQFSPTGRLSETRMLSQLLRIGLERVEEAAAVSVYDEMATVLQGEDQDQLATSRELTMRARRRKAAENAA